MELYGPVFLRTKNVNNSLECCGIGIYCEIDVLSGVSLKCFDTMHGKRWLYDRFTTVLWMWHSCSHNVVGQSQLFVCSSFHLVAVASLNTNLLFIYMDVETLCDMNVTLQYRDTIRGWFCNDKIAIAFVIKTPSRTKTVNKDKS